MEDPMPRRNLLFRVLAAGATFSAGALVVGALTFGRSASAEPPAPMKVASLTDPQASRPAPPKIETSKPKPKSEARKFVPVPHFGGY
jgi:hypothetical protein